MAIQKKGLNDLLSFQGTTIYFQHVCHKGNFSKESSSFDFEWAQLTIDIIE